MNDIGASMAKLAGIRQAAAATLALRDRAGRPELVFDPNHVGHYFTQTAALISRLKELLPGLYADFQSIDTQPTRELQQQDAAAPKLFFYARNQLERLVRDVDQILEIRANSELSQPAANSKAEPRRVFISHGRSPEWREIQAYIEKDIGLPTLELAQEPNAGQTIIEKLENNASSCDSAVIVMSGDDIDAEGKERARENVMHEIGFFQAKFGRARVCLLHQEEVSIPTNLAGVVYIPFPKGNVSASFGVLTRELKTMYKH